MDDVADLSGVAARGLQLSVSVRPKACSCAGETGVVLVPGPHLGQGASRRRAPAARRARCEPGAVIVTDLPGSPKALYECKYCARGEAEHASRTRSSTCSAVGGETRRGAISPQSVGHRVGLSPANVLGGLDHQRGESAHPCRPEARQRPRDADRRDDLSHAAADRCRHAAHGFAPLATVDGIALLGETRFISRRKASGSTTVRGEWRVTRNGARAAASTLPGEQGLARRHAVRKAHVHRSRCRRAPARRSRSCARRRPRRHPAPRGEPPRVCPTRSADMKGCAARLRSRCTSTAEPSSQRRMDAPEPRRVSLICRA